MHVRLRLSLFSLLAFVLLSLLPSFGQAAGKYPVLNWQQLEARNPSVGMRLFYYLLRNDAGLMNSDEDVLRNFMATNNCQNATFSKTLSSEFDYPAMKAFYQSKAPEILKTAPMTLTVALNGFYLGQYDTTKHVFPFTDNHGAKKPPTVFHDLEPANDLQNVCPTLAARGVTQNRNFYAYYLHFKVNVQPVSISELRMDEDSARSFVQSLRFGQAGAGRPVTLLVDMEIHDAPTKLGPHLPNVGYAPVNVEGKIRKISIISTETNKTLGVILP